MPGLGLAGGYGAAAGGNALADIIKQKLMELQVQSDIAARKEQLALSRSGQEQSDRHFNAQLAAQADERRLTRETQAATQRDQSEKEQANNFQLSVTSGYPGQDMTESADVVKGNRYAAPVIAGLRRDGSEASLPTFSSDATTAAGDIKGTGAERGAGLRLYNPKQQAKAGTRTVQTVNDKGENVTMFVPGEVGEQYAEQPKPVATSLSANQESLLVERLSKQWDKAVEPAVDIDRQVKLMRTGMNAARRGDMAQGSQSVLVTFQKILDPPSVVRESEYMRSAAGLALIDRARGFAERLAIGGAGVPIGELEKYAQLAEEMAQAQQTGYLESVRKRIKANSSKHGIADALIFTEVPSISSASEPTSAAPSKPVGEVSVTRDPATGKLTVKRGGG